MSNMTPVRVRLAGFLSYRESQELRFESARLWLLTGPNGSGKSALFDAITFALFGQHRGGSGSTGELIHKDASRCDLEFDFQIGGETYRIERSLRRTRSGAAGSQGILQRVNNEWHPLPETHRKAEFDDWIAEHIGLTFEAFTASTLLRQGHAEKLLDATPKGRAEVLASIVRLERYEQLHERANQEKLKYKAIVEAIGIQSQGMATVMDDEIEAAKQQLVDAERDAESARKAVKAAERLLESAHRWSQLTDRRRESQARVASAEALLAESNEIEADYARLQELIAVVPVAESVILTRAKRSESEHRTQRFMKQQEAVRQQKDRLDRELAIAKAKRQELTSALAGDEAKLAALGQRLRSLATTLQTVKLVEEQTADKSRIAAEIQRFPEDLADQLAAAQSEAERLTKLGQQLPLLERIHAERNDLEDAIERKNAAAEASERIRREGETARTQHDEIQRRLAEAEENRKHHEAAFAEAELQSRLAEAAVRSLEQIQGSASCSVCGQPISDGHFCEEKTRRIATLKHAQASLALITPQHEESKKTCDELRRSEAESNEELSQLRGDYKEQSNLLAAAMRDIERHERSIAQATAALSAEFKTVVPNREMLEQLHAKHAKLEDVHRRAKQLQDRHSARQSLQQQLASIQSSLNRLAASLPPGTLTLREEQQAKQAEEASLIQAVKAGKRAIEEAEREIDRLARQSHEALAELTDLTGKLRSEDSTREHCGEIIDREMRKLPAEWQMRVESAGLGDLAVWKDSREELIAKQVPESRRHLDAARAGLDALKEDVRRWETESDAIAVSERAMPEEVNERLAAARMALQLAEAELANRRSLSRRHENFIELRARLDVSTREAEREFHQWKRLADLLGRDGLQRHLVRDAEREIVRIANQFLNKLTGEQLTLHLANEGEAEKALELQAIHGNHAIAAAFLSGSQKFRVAVALALGRGEFAGAKQSPCLMIDEGFGSLDAAGRAAMIRELHMLSERLPCILVVSHDADFAGAFENAYRLELIDGATRVIRSIGPGNHFT